MNEDRIREIVRNFPENGMKVLLQTPANVRELLALGKFEQVGHLMLEKMTVDPTAYVAADFRHGASDLVLSVPRRVGGRRSKVPLWLTILIEHQSEPDRLMVLRLLDYMVQIWKKQVRDHVKKHGSDASVKLQPILPVVFYAGRYRWEKLGQLVDLMVDAAELHKHLPEFEPVYVNLPELTSKQLDQAGGVGQVLRVVQVRREPRRRFEQVLGNAVAELDALARPQRDRWRDLLSYLTGLVYHERPTAERQALAELIAASAKANEDRLEINMARETIAQAIGKEYAANAERAHAARTLVRQLELRFGEVPAEVADAIQRTRDVKQLDQWLDRVVTAKTLGEVGIESPA